MDGEEGAAPGYMDPAALSGVNYSAILWFVQILHDWSWLVEKNKLLNFYVMIGNGEGIVWL